MLFIMAKQTTRQNGPAPIAEPQETLNGVYCYRPNGKYSLVEAVDLVSAAIACCRLRRANKLLVDATGIEDLPIPTLVDRFLMVEDWALAAKGMVVMAMVIPDRYIHPQKFGVKVAAQLGLTCDVYTSEEAARQWLLEYAPK
ncbi:MAG: hypothetical protein ABI607_02825 [Betaproteobacteria bacterium]